MERQEKKLIKQWKKTMRMLQSEDLQLYHKKISYLLFINHFSDYLLKFHSFPYLKKVLCIGCHQGHWVHRLDQQKNIKGFIVDQSPKLLTLSMHLYPHFSYALMDSDSIPYKDKKFHFCILNLPIEILCDQQATLEEIYRTLKQKGELICFTKRISNSETNIQSFEQIGFQNIQKTYYKSICVFEMKK